MRKAKAMLQAHRETGINPTPEHFVMICILEVLEEIRDLLEQQDDYEEQGPANQSLSDP